MFVSSLLLCWIQSPQRFFMSFGNFNEFDGMLKKGGVPDVVLIVCKGIYVCQDEATYLVLLAWREEFF